MQFSNKVYDVLNKIQRWLPCVGTLYLAIAKIYDLPYGDKINETVVALATFLATTLEISTSNYHKTQYEALNINDYSAREGQDG